MLKIHPKVLKRNGRSEFVVLPYEEFQALQERLADAEDLLALRRARRTDSGLRRGLTPQELIRKLGAKRGRRK